MSYLIRSISNIVSGESVPQSVVIAQNIISDYQYWQPSTEKRIIHLLNDQLDLIQCMIKNIEEYHTGVKEKTRQMTEKKRTIPDDVSNYIFLGKNAHDAHLNSLFEFLEFIILRSNEAVNLGTDNIDKLWRLFV